MHDPRDARDEATPTPGTKRKAVTSEEEPCWATIMKKVGDAYLLQTQDGREYHLDVSNVDKWHRATSDEDDSDKKSSSNEESSSDEASSDESEPQDGRFWECKHCDEEIFVDDDDGPRRCTACKRKRPSSAKIYVRQYGVKFEPATSSSEAED